MNPASADPVTSRYADHDLLGPLVVTYVEELPEALGELEAAVKAEDHVKIAKLSHRLTGDAASYGFAVLSELARALEVAKTEEERGAAWQQVEDLGRRICGATKK